MSHNYCIFCNLSDDKCTCLRCRLCGNTEFYCTCNPEDIVLDSIYDEYGNNG